MDHTPAQNADDDRPLRILERAPVEDAHKQRMFELVRHAQQVAREAGRELQAEFGREAVAMIVGCNQFIRLHRGGDVPGRVEVLVPADVKQQLQDAGFELLEAQGAVFKLFGWTGVDPMQADVAALKDAVEAAFTQAATKST